MYEIAVMFWGSVAGCVVAMAAFAGIVNAVRAARVRPWAELAVAACESVSVVDPGHLIGLG